VARRSRDAVDDTIRRIAAHFGVPGAAVAIVENGETARHIFGEAQLGSGRPVRDTTVFSIASCAKAFTAAAVARLAAGGLLTFDDRVRTHLPAFALYDPWVSDNITLRDLIGMRTGVDRTGVCEWGSNPSIALAGLIPRWRHTPPACGFREKYLYTNPAYYTLAEIVSRVSRQPFATFLDEAVLRPLGMSDTVLSEGVFRHGSEHATPHGKSDGVVMPLPEARCGGRLGESCMYVSARDAALWLTHMLSDSAPREMFVPLSLGVAEPRLGRTFQHYCMGWEECDYFGDLIHCHEGGEFGVSSRTMLNREKRLGVSVYLSISSPAVRAMSLAIYDLCTGRPPRDWAGELGTWMPGDAEARTADLHATKYGHEPNAPFPWKDAFDGAFSSSGNGRIIVRVSGEAGITFHDASVYDGTLEHLGGEVFRLRPHYAGMADLSKGRTRVRLTMSAERKPIVDVMGFGLFEKVS
jgi:CubicO group peptidase (beta-lactamase class C family)